MKLNLSFKIIGIVFIISIISVSLNFFLNFNQVTYNLESAEIEKGKAITRSLTASINDIKKIDDKEFILSIVNKQLWLDSEIINIQYYLKKGDKFELFYESGYSSDEKTIDDEINQNLIGNNIIHHEIITEQNQRILRVITPVHVSGQNVAAFQIDMTLENLDKTIKKSMTNLVFFGLLFLFSIVLFVFLFLRLFVITPILELNKGVNEIAIGNFNFKIKKHSKDEIGELSDSFNKMAQEIKTANLEIKKHEHELEKQVEKRTKELQDKIEQLEKFQRLTVGREIKMVELKKQLEELKKKK